MKTIIEKVSNEQLNSEVIEKAGEILKNGGLVAFPTETVYGLGADALNESAAEKIYAAKGRPSDNPLIVHISDMKDLEEIAEVVSKKALGQLDGPCIFFNLEGYYNSLRNQLETMISYGLSSSKRQEGIYFCDTLEDVLAHIEGH